MLNSVATSLRALEYLATSGEAGISDMSRDLGITTGTAYRMARTLVSSGYAEQNRQTRKYRLGPKLVLLANSLRRGVGVRELAAPQLEELARRSGETINLGTLAQGEVVYLEKISSSELLTIEIKVGSRVIAHCTGLGKAILAFLPEAELDSYLRQTRFPRLTKNTVRSAAALRRQLAEVRRTGYALDESELLDDVRCVAAPILNGRGRPLAAISISAPRSRFEEKRSHLVAQVTEAARTISVLSGELDRAD